jgi:hypothetical protein
MNRYNDRLKFCHRLRAVLPDHFNIVCGAPRYPFIRIDRGESIVGSSDRSAWSRTPIGARFMSWDVDRAWRPVKVFEFEQVPVHMMRTHISAERCIAAINSESWWDDDSRIAGLVAAADQYLRPCPPEMLDSQIKVGERLERRIHALPDKDSTGRKFAWLENT